MQQIGSIIAVLAVIPVLSVYSLSSMFLFVEGVIVGGVSCTPQGGGKTHCCANVYNEIAYPDGTKGYQLDTYCTTCDNTNPPSNCTPREKQGIVVNPGRDLSNILEGGVLEQPTTPPSRGTAGPLKEGGVLEQPATPQFGQSLGPNFGEFLQNENNMTFSRANISSSNSTNNILSLQQSDLNDDNSESDDQEEESDDSSEDENDDPEDEEK